MIRCPHRVNFRMTEMEHERYSALIGKITGCRSWTELCLKALEDLCQHVLGPRMPLGSVPSTLRVAEVLDDLVADKRQAALNGNGHCRVKQPARSRRQTLDRASDKKPTKKPAEGKVAGRNGKP